MKHWLVTWTTYATWLPGDSRGFRTWRGREYVPPPQRYAVGDRPTYDAGFYKARLEAARTAADAEVNLSAAERQVVLASVRDELQETVLKPTVLAVGAAHVHLLAEFGEVPIRRMVGRLKAAATRAMREKCGSEPDKRFWAKGCHMRSCDDDASIRSAFEYVERHRNEGAAIHVWRTP